MNKQKVQNVRKTNVGVAVHGDPKIKSNVGVALLGDPKGVTLIALVITIVVLIILAAVAINLVLNENGIFRRARQASDSYKISEYKERIEIAVLEAKMQNIQEPIDFLGRVKEILENDTSLKDATIKRVIYENKDTLVIVVSDYAFTVDDIEVKYVGKAKDFTIPDASDTNIIFKVSTLEWTDVVNVEIETTEVGYEIEYRIGEKEWNKYTQALEITENTTVDARLIIGSMYGEYVRKIITNIDDVPPTATITIAETGYVGESIEAQVEHTDNSGKINLEKCKWIFTTTQEKIGLDETLYTGGPFTENPQTITVLGNEELRYYLHVLTTDKAGNKQETISTGVTLQTLTFTSQTFDYSGSVETFVVPANGIYKLEVYGAQGGNSPSTATNTDLSSQGGKGGYSVGYICLKKDTKLYICVGGKGSDNNSWSNVSGGYNGGGSGAWYNLDNYAIYKSGGGGGATHIATIDGTLSKIGSVKLNNILLVAGGGGGSMSVWWGSCAGGNGGGLSGNDGSRAKGGTQTSGNSFGQGYNASHDGVINSSGGGGGLYGGYGEGAKGAETSGGGGSGYIGGVPSFEYKGTTYSPSTTNGARSGNGQAKITFVTF